MEINWPDADITPAFLATSASPTSTLQADDFVPATCRNLPDVGLAQSKRGLQSERVIALHPKIADDYRREVRELDRLLDCDTPETREEVIPRLRPLLDSIVVMPAKTRRGVDIGISGRLTTMIELATGQPLGDRGMLTLERVKGIEPSS